MKRHLKSMRLGLSLLAGLGVCAPALAQEKRPIELAMGGYFTQSLNLVNANKRDEANFEDEVIAQNGEIYFKAKTDLPNGGVIGVRIELEAEGSSDDFIDEHYLYLKGDWGKVILGAENGVGHLMQVRAPRFVPGLKMFDNSVTEKIIEDVYDFQFEDENVIEDAHMSTKLEHISGDANKLSYLTPKVGGLQMAVSYTPNNRDRNGGKNNVATSQRTRDGVSGDKVQHDIVELAMRYSGFYRGVGFRLSYSEVDAKSYDSPTNPKSTSNGLQVYWDDWVLGANLSKYNGLDQLPGTAYEDSASIETLNYALKYKRGDSYWGVGVTQSEESELQQPGHATNYEEIMIGGGKKITDGVQLGYYYQVTEVDRPFATQDEKRSAEADVLGLTLALSF
jgi:outer membrane protein OmpU